MTSKQRVRAAFEHKNPDRTPAAYEAVGAVTKNLLARYGYTEYSQLVEKFEIDIMSVSPKYIGPELKEYLNENGERVVQSYWGWEDTYHKTAVDSYGTTSYFPLSNVKTVEDVNSYTFPNPDWFDYSCIKEQCDKYSDKAIIIGHEGPFQIVTFLIEMDKFFMLMIDEPEVAQAILDKMNEFEMEFYERIFKAAEGKIDILRVHDDYGTQISLLFSVDMWREFFMKNTKKLVDLAHKYDAFYQQHSCGAVLPIIPELVACGVDSLEPLQKVEGLSPENLSKSFGGKITFHGGIDTQGILPYGTANEVKAETEKYIKLLNEDGKGGYILMASQAFEGDVPLENIEALYSVKR